jgi:hypothetical protein
MQAERRDARLFANNAQRKIARALGVTPSNHSIEDIKLLDLVSSKVGRENAVRPRISEQTGSCAHALVHTCVRACMRGPVRSCVLCGGYVLLCLR